MKIVTSNFGTASVRVSNDEVNPPNGFPYQEIVGFIGERYSFSTRPPDVGQLTQPVIQPMIFQGGSVTLDEKKVAVLAITLVPDGDIVFAPTTELADQILTGLISDLEHLFGFRYSTAKQVRVYQSNLTVEFESAIEDRLQGLKKLHAILNREIRREMPFDLKRLAFGSGDVLNSQMQLQPNIDQIERSDFLLERRAGASYELNRYYSAAPMKTVDHMRLLEMIERELLE
jgi:hypothetical protein